MHFPVEIDAVEEVDALPNIPSKSQVHATHRRADIFTQTEDTEPSGGSELNER
jgi:hypothetical protein